MVSGHNILVLPCLDVFWKNRWSRLFMVSLSVWRDNLIKQYNMSTPFSESRQQIINTFPL
jgi:hypothetical protein